MSWEVKQLLEKLPPYQGKKRLIKSRQFTHDIMQDIMRKHRECIKHYDSIAGTFWKNSPEATAENLYWFAKRNLPYRVEPTLTQTSKTPAAILEERNSHGNDCKQYASFIVGVGEALRRQGYPVKCFYRFASYKPDTRAPGHVFAVFVQDGKEIWVDPVPETGGFNKRLIKPVYTTDKMPPMSKNGNNIGSLYDISGLPANRIVAGMSPTRIVSGMSNNQFISGMHWLDTMPGSVGKAGKGKAKVKAAIKKLAPKEIKKGIKNTAQDIKKGAVNTQKKVQTIKPGKVLKKVSLASGRNAYLALIKMNAGSIATNLHNKAKKVPENWAKLKSKWESLGGDSNKLSTAIDQGVAHYNKRHPNNQVSGMGNGYDTEGTINLYANAGDVEEGGIGMAAAAGAALIAAAAPIMLALAGLLKAFGIHKQADEKDVLDADAETMADHNNATDVDGDGNKNIVGDGVDQGNGVTTKVSTDATGQQTVEYDVDEDAGEDSDGEYTKTKVTTKTKTKHGGGFEAMLANVTDFVSDHKTWFIVGGIAIIAVLFLPKMLNKSKGRRK